MVVFIWNIHLTSFPLMCYGQSWFLNTVTISSLKQTLENFHPTTIKCTWINKHWTQLILFIIHIISFRVSFLLIHPITNFRQNIMKIKALNTKQLSSATQRTVLTHYIGINGAPFCDKEECFTLKSLIPR